MPNASSMLAPVIALVIWSAIIWAWMYATRIPAIIKVRMVLDPMAPRGEQMAQLPPKVRWKADNYNHLMEQPTLFYAVAISLAVLGDHSISSVAMAWGYVALRVVHSLVQTTWNKIEVRFALFFISSLVLFGL
ncbi:MAG TPA: MAPEG family protein, partial [Luteimonas sp.]|nr:MAPEG family protein [Luteimonas sp.]